MEVNVLEFLTLSGTENMALDWFLFKTKKPYFRLYKWKNPTLTLGKLQKIDKENFIKRLPKEIDLARRPSGGRAVLHHFEITYFISLPTGESIYSDYEKIAIPILNSLNQLGIKAKMVKKKKGMMRDFACFTAPSWCEISLENQKIVGSAQYREPKFFMQHGSIIYKTSPYEEKVFGFKVTNIDIDFDEEKFKKLLLNELSKNFKLNFLTNEETIGLVEKSKIFIRDFTI